MSSAVYFTTDDAFCCDVHLDLNLRPETSGEESTFDLIIWLLLVWCAQLGLVDERLDFANRITSTRHSLKTSARRKRLCRISNLARPSTIIEDWARDAFRLIKPKRFV